MIEDVFVCDAQIHSVRVCSIGFALALLWLWLWFGFALVIELKGRESLFYIIRTYLFNGEYLLCIY